ncbi:hypothetical protein ACWCQL_34300 [Streptomyces sp. NPDC002073]
MSEKQQVPPQDSGLTLVESTDGGLALVGEETGGIVGTLSLRYVGAAPVLVSTGATAVPGRLPVVDGQGRLIGTYEISAPQVAEPAAVKAGGHQIGLALELEQ